MKRSISAGLIVAFFVALLPVNVVNAQRIGIEENSSDTAAETEATRGSSSSSSRIIPPEEFGKYRNQKKEQSELTKDALIEKLRADSASMRIRYQETLRQLRADSKTMRKQIERLRRQNKRLRKRLAEAEGSGEAETDTTIKPTMRSTPSTPAETSSPEPSQTADTPDEESLPEGAKLNPNSASLSDLKTVPGLSDRLAERIQWYRREVRPFKKLQDLRRVPGIDRNLFDRIKKHFHEGPY